MAECPKCKTTGAYIGFNSIECPNKKCEHYSSALDVKPICCCCGGQHSISECPTVCSLSADYDDSGGNWPSPVCPPPPDRDPGGPTAGPPPDWCGD